METGLYRFSGGIESISGQKLWIKGSDLTIPVSLENTKCYLMPQHEGEGLPETPEQIRWNRLSTLAEGVKVFIGGQLEMYDSRLNFISTKEKPLMVIFYSCPDSELTSAVIRCARTRNEYWNPITPVSLVIGALSLVYIAMSLLNRPAFNLTVITAMVAIFVPFLPIIPPGLLFTSLYRRIAWHARKLRTFHDLANLDILSEHPASMARSYAIKAYTLESVAWLILISAVAINAIFIMLILILLGV